MSLYVLKDFLKSGPSLIFLSVLFLLLFIDFPMFDTPKVSPVKEAEAVVGRPATPGSVAGTHRRTRRRTKRRVAAGTRVTTLPGGCTTVMRGGVKYHHCDGVYYRPYYEGNKVVYVVEEP